MGAVIVMSTRSRHQPLAPCGDGLSNPNFSGPCDVRFCALKYAPFSADAPTLPDMSTAWKYASTGLPTLGSPPKVPT